MLQTAILSVYINGIATNLKGKEPVTAFDITSRQLQ
jgi:hypothetical protein